MSVRAISLGFLRWLKFLLPVMLIACPAAFSGSPLVAFQASTQATTPAPASQNPQTTPAQSADKPPAQSTARSTDQSNPKTVQESNDASADALRAQIKGHEQEPASKVFKNVKWLTEVPANTFLNIMNIGYSRALGVKCEYCHDESDYSSDAKRPKRAAREMQVLHRSANDQLVKMQNLQPKPEGGHFINCGTCHRGMIDPTKPLPSR